jgi:hypothetical protein
MTFHFVLLIQLNPRLDLGKRISFKRIWSKTQSFYLFGRGITKSQIGESI